MIKKVPGCASKQVVGIQSGRQEYKCLGCRKYFQVSKRSPRSDYVSALWRAYVWEKMTLQELSVRFEMSIPVVRSLLARHQENTIPPYISMVPQSVYLVIEPSIDLGVTNDKKPVTHLLALERYQI
jgi:hypothetical protein